MSDTPFSDNTSSTADVVTAVDFTGTTLTLTKQVGDDLTTTISSSPPPFAFAQSDNTRKIEDTGYFENNAGSGTIIGGAEVTELSKTITPTSSSQKVLIHVTIFGEWDDKVRMAGCILKRTIGSGNPTLIQPTISGNQMSIGGGFNIVYPVAESYSTPEMCNFVYVDSPNTTDTITYVPQVCHAQGNDFYLNFTKGNVNGVVYERGFSTMTLECKNV